MCVAVTQLSELLAQVNTDRISAREIARRTERAGQPIGHATVAKYLNGSHGEPEDRILRALAEVLPVTLSALRTAAQVPVGEHGPYVPPDIAHRLSGRQRKALDELIRAMTEADEQSQETGHEQGATISEIRRAARLRPRTESPKRDR